MLSEFEKCLDYSFKKKSLLEEALRHSSYANECKNGLHSNERLEFLGDSVLSVVVSEHIFKAYPNRPEGELTKLRASLVCEKSLAAYAREISLGKYLMLGKGEQQTGGANRDSLLADAFEAVIAAIYLDGGMPAAKKHITRFIAADLNDGAADAFFDYKTKLQETVQKQHDGYIEYVLINESGPDHQKSFTMEVRIKGRAVGIGTGKSKKEAEQLAAKRALGEIGQES